jgi:hypothetical protein
MYFRYPLGVFNEMLTRSPQKKKKKKRTIFFFYKIFFFFKKKKKINTLTNVAYILFIQNTYGLPLCKSLGSKTQQGLLQKKKKKNSLVNLYPKQQFVKKHYQLNKGMECKFPQQDCDSINLSTLLVTYSYTRDVCQT